MAKPETIERRQRKPLTAQQAKEKANELAKKKARIAQILSTGLTAQMLRIKHKDPSKRYCYIRNRDVDIERYQALGYVLDTDQPKKENVHKTGDDRKVVGDTVLMSIGREDFELIEEVKSEMVERRHASNPAQVEYMKQAEKAAARGEAAPPLDLTKEG